jgi:predicted DNA-binding WGR domain protein
MARRFEMEDGGSRKFWEIAIEGPTVTVRFGRIGTDGQVKSKQHGTAEDAAKEAGKLVAEKTKKGYVEVASAGASAPEAPKVTPPVTAPPERPAAPVGPQFSRLYDADGHREVTWCRARGSSRSS